MKLVLFTGDNLRLQARKAVELATDYRTEEVFSFVHVLSARWYADKVAYDLYGYNRLSKKADRKILESVEKALRKIDPLCLVKASLKFKETTMYKSSLVIYDDISSQKEVDFLKSYFDTNPFIIGVGKTGTIKPNVTINETDRVGRFVKKFKGDL